jgi:thiol-disulfide isomerase/thioredoxin
LAPLRLFRLEGGTTDLSALRGKPILLNFWASWCAACRMELPALDRLYLDPRRARVHVVAVSEDRGPREAVARFVKSLRSEGAFSMESVDTATTATPRFSKSSSLDSSSLSCILQIGQ